MQMKKTAAAVKKHSDVGLLYISVLTNPTMGGVSASFALSADIVLAEKGTMISFAGPRVIEQNTGVKLPKGFQTAEFQLSHGFVDDIVARVEMREYLGRLIQLHGKKHRYINSFKLLGTNNNKQYHSCSLSAWQTVQKVCANGRSTSLDYIEKIFDYLLELHGDRTFSDDHVIVGGIGSLGGQAVTVIGEQKGKKSLDEAIYRNWGMPSPAGYRKALRLMKQAEKFKRPIICFVDTIGAACGKEAEEQGQGYVIAELLKEMSAIKVPILSIIHSGGRSGGALALGVANEVWMLENAVYSVLTSEGYASILWKDSTRADEAAGLMKSKSGDLYQMQVVDKVFSEPDVLNIESMERLCLQLKGEIMMFLKKYQKKKGKYILTNRYERFCKF